MALVVPITQGLSLVVPYLSAGVSVSVSGFVSGVAHVTVNVGLPTILSAVGATAYAGFPYLSAGVNGVANIASAGLEGVVNTAAEITNAVTGSRSRGGSSGRGSSSGRGGNSGRGGSNISSSK